MENVSPSERTVLMSLWGSLEAGPTGKSSSRESTSLQPDMEERECWGLIVLGCCCSCPPGEEEEVGEITEEGLKWA